MEEERHRCMPHTLSDAFVAVQETPDERAKLISISSTDRRFTFVVYPTDSMDKEGYRQLGPFFYLAEELRLYKAQIEGIDDPCLKKFDFLSANLDWTRGNAEIVLLPHKDENERHEIKILLQRTTDTFSLEQESMKSQRRITG